MIIIIIIGTEAALVDTIISIYNIFFAHYIFCIFNSPASRYLYCISIYRYLCLLRDHDGVLIISFGRYFAPPPPIQYTINIMDIISTHLIAIFLRSAHVDVCPYLFSGVFIIIIIII